MDKQAELNVNARKWAEWKRAVGMSVQVEKHGDLRTVDDVLLNCKATGFDSVICQTAVQTEEDVAASREKGYAVSLTEPQFRERFKIAPARVFYSASISLMSFYFNPDTLAVCPLHIEMHLARQDADFDLPGFGVENSYRAIETREREVAAGDYSGSIMTLTDKMRLEYFQMLIEKKGAENIPGLYRLFVDFYECSDYGFDALDSGVIDAILARKTDEEKQETQAALADLPEQITVYRGGNSLSVPFDRAYSWTLNMSIANFFATRRGNGPGYIATATVAKEDIIEYIDSSEEEILVSPDKVKITDVIAARGLDFIEENLYRVAETYREYIGRMSGLEFQRHSYIHDRLHQARVAILALLIAEIKGLPKSDWRVLAEAAIYHDTRRLHDGRDTEHGLFAREYYMENETHPDPLVAHICQYHCRSDEEGYAAIRSDRRLSKNRTRSMLLYDIFKDADALDRVRLGLTNLDIHQLRTPEAKTLTLVAKLLEENVKL